MKHLPALATFSLLLITLFANAQSKAIIAGPMLGLVELRTAQVWLQVSPAVKSVVAKVWKKGEINQSKQYPYTGAYGPEFNRIKITFTALEPGTSYQYQFVIDGKTVAAATGEFTTQELWQWRRPAPDFSFLTGSCAYFNDPLYDRPGKPYGLDSSIFETMAKERNAAFMLWLGDNWYTREADYFSEWGLNRRASKDRSTAALQPFLKAMPHYAIWDDHDYGPDDSDKSYWLKEASRNVFMNSWCNPSSGENGQGVYSKFTYNDADIFMLDDRWFRSNDATPDSINGQSNTEKRMYGQQQMEWFKNALRSSNTNPNIRVRIIATGSQVLNPVSPKDCFRHFSLEYKEMMDFLANEKINGVVFLTGDRHLSQIIKTERPGLYPLFDITSSALTSGGTKLLAVEKGHPAMVLGIEGKQNYSRLTISGLGDNRKLLVEFLGVKGEELGEWSVALKDITGSRP